MSEMKCSAMRTMHVPMPRTPGDSTQFRPCMLRTAENLVVSLFSNFKTNQEKERKTDFLLSVIKSPKLSNMKHETGRSESVSAYMTHQNDRTELPDTYVRGHVMHLQTLYLVFLTLCSLILQRLKSLASQSWLQRK